MKLKNKVGICLEYPLNPQSSDSSIASRTRNTRRTKRRTLVFPSMKILLFKGALHWASQRKTFSFYFIQSRLIFIQKCFCECCSFLKKDHAVPKGMPYLLELE